ncbi:glycoside hydrolase family 92 protein [Multifurca ochricompacta]|uniref:Glycoside hydrolase family 92 protein n=1 Tax=Multifurca ochricompacta TaxID=376703 RepID=A0AAD4M0H7_9AGAM|nr:glycoside hydrolase family 92 protein [Multifurca ochricompacta]
MHSFLLLPFLPLFFSLVQCQDPASFVNLFIGTTKGGHAFPGATLPHGMVKVGMDTDSPENHAGYDANPAFLVTGFSQLHDDGTGGSPPLSNFKVFPSANCSSFDSCPTTINARKIARTLLVNGLPDDFASPGYFSTNLSSGVRVELTATRRTSIQRYTFPSHANGSMPRINKPTISINPITGRVIGGSNFQASFGPGRYNAFTCVDFQLASPGSSSQAVTPIEYGVWSSRGPVRGTVTGEKVSTDPRSPLGALLTFPAAETGPTVVLVRSGVSLISMEQACANAEAEIPNFDFDKVATAARAEWNDLLGRVGVEIAPGQEDLRVLLYSSLYRTHISPADYTGENPLWTSTEPYYDSFYCNWDTYRTLYPLYSLHDPQRFALIVRGMVNIQQHEVPWPTQQQWVQGGSNGDPIVAEFLVKFWKQAASLNVPAESAYAALLADAETLPPNFDLQGRQIDTWQKYNYLPVDVSKTAAGGSARARVVSRALEYAFDDFTISQVAKILGHSADASKVFYDSLQLVLCHTIRKLFNNWNPNITVPGGPNSVLGMMQPRKLDGTFAYTDPRHCSVNDPTGSTCFLDPNARDGFYEGSPLLYVPHDMATLVKLQGGPQNFIDRLDFIIDNGYFDVTDEPGQQIPFMYHYADRPGKSTVRSRQTIAQWFNTSVTGLPGNDDSGAMGSFAFFLLAGLYPVPATEQFLLSSPFFPSISFFNPLYNTKTTIRAKTFTANAIFIKTVTIDGAPWRSNCYIEWDVFVRGGTIELELTEEDPNVGCGGSLPPSLSTGGFGNDNAT